MKTEPTAQYPKNEERRGNNKALIMLLTLIFGSLALFLLFTFLVSNKQGKREETSLSPTSAVRISGSQQPLPLPQIDTLLITDAGFSPVTLRIHRGTAVKWINKSSTDNVSVNSDDYPTNTRFPELNLGKVARGSSLAHIFDTPGIYTYHNQFSPKQTGTVIVE